MSPAWLWWVLGLVVLTVASVVVRRRSVAARLAAVRRTWGHAKVRERGPGIARFHLARTDSARSIDDRTWADLNMDEVFAVLDRTESVVGQQVLYGRMRSSPAAPNLPAFEALVTRMQETSALRESTQMALGRLSDPAGYDLLELTSPGALNTKPWFIIFPLISVAMVSAVVAVPFWPPAALLIVVGTIGGLILRAIVAPRLRVVATAFSQVGPLLSVAKQISTLDTPTVSPLLGHLRHDLMGLAGLRRIASWAGRDSTAAASGDIGALIVEYANLLFALDANALYFGARQLRVRAPELLRVFSAVGEVDAAISIASYRAGTIGWTRPTFRPGGTPLQVSGAGHPLLPDVVRNSFVLGPPHGVIVTGSNMSGKSTFLRTVGVTAIMAQTLNTCVAETYEGPPFAVRTCIGRADDPASGKSYYLVEVESVLALVEAARSDVPHLMLFDELFRGTNAIERIAAAEAVLVALLTRSTLAAAPHIVIAATHDGELVGLLEDIYDAYHFADAMNADGLVFDYRLRRGEATTRNAIALLEQRGAPPELVARARDRVAALEPGRRRP